MRNLDIADSRQKIEQYAAQPMEQGQLRVEHGTLFGDLPEGGSSRIASNPTLDGTEEAALDEAAIESGVD
jgi:argininosuccinate synthase